MLAAIEKRDGMDYRLATKEEINQLVRMRWDFTLEDYPEMITASDGYEAFEEECTDFLEQALASDRWHIWIAEDKGRVISHMYIELIEKVPRPGRITRPFAYMTNVYTVPDWRGKGIGGKLLSQVNAWVKDNDYEFVIVWPSEEGVDFYKRHGYEQCNDPLEYVPS